MRARAEWGLVCLGLVSLLGVAASQVHSFDIFWQLQSGRYILETGSFIHRDIFSLAAEAPRFEHCWLHDLIFYGAYRLGGYEAISLLKGALVLAIGSLTVATARGRGASVPAILLISVPAILNTRGAWLERPQLWTFLFFCLFVLLLEKYRRQPGAALWVLVPLMVLWANLHAGSILAVPILAAYLGGEGVTRVLGRSELSALDYRRLWWVALTLPLAMLCTPYGMETLKTLVMAPLLGTASGMSTQIYNMDWRPTTFAGAPGYFYAVGGVFLLLLTGWKRFAATDLFLLGGLAYMGFGLERHGTFFFLAAGALLPRYVDAIAGYLPPMKTKALAVLRLSVLFLAIAGIVTVARPAWRDNGFFDTGLRRWHYPVEAATFVAENHLPKNLYNTYDWGGYLMWTLFPDYQVFWDGRSDSVEMFDLGLTVMRGDQGWRGILDRFEVNTVVSKACTVDTGQHYPLLDRLREDPAWALVFADQSALVFVRRSAVDSVWLLANSLAAERIDDTILSEATLLTGVNAGRYMGWWEMGRILMARKDYPAAFAALGKHLSHAPAGGHVPAAENYYRILYPMMNGKPQ